MSEHKDQRSVLALHYRQSQTDQAAADAALLEIGLNRHGTEAGSNILAGDGNFEELNVAENFTIIMGNK